MRYLIPTLSLLAISACSDEPAPEELTQQALAEIESEAMAEPDVLNVTEAFADYLGAWRYQDGTVRQIFIGQSDNSVLACMQISDGPDQWVQVSEGVYVADNDNRSFTGVFTGSGMGVDELTVTGYPVPEGGLDFINRARIDETQAVTYETWSEPDEGQFEYIIEQEVQGGGRNVLFSGIWERVTLVEASCDPS